jgi:hypothetical protein
MNVIKTVRVKVGSEGTEKWIHSPRGFLALAITTGLVCVVFLIHDISQNLSGILVFSKARFCKVVKYSRGLFKLHPYVNFQRFKGSGSPDTRN